MKFEFPNNKTCSALTFDQLFELISGPLSRPQLRFTRSFRTPPRESPHAQWFLRDGCNFHTAIVFGPLRCLRPVAPQCDWRAALPTPKPYLATATPAEISCLRPFSRRIIVSETFQNIPKVSESFGDWSLDYIFFTYGFGPVM